jgi:hypothetical protein
VYCTLYVNNFTCNCTSFYFMMVNFHHILPESLKMCVPTWRRLWTCTRGAPNVLVTAPATAPARRCLHQPPPSPPSIARSRVCVQWCVC